MTDFGHCLKCGLARHLSVDMEMRHRCPKLTGAKGDTASGDAPVENVSPRAHLSAQLDERAELRARLAEVERLWSCAQVVLFHDECGDQGCEESDCAPCRAQDVLDAWSRRMSQLDQVEGTTDGE